MIFADIFSLSSLWPLFILLGASAIGLIVFLLRKYIPGLTEKEEFDEAKLAEDNVNAVIETEVISAEEPTAEESDDEETTK